VEGVEKSKSDPDQVPALTFSPGGHLGAWQRGVALLEPSSSGTSSSPGPVGGSRRVGGCVKGQGLGGV
jgi:hypothetical protein